MVKGWMLVVDNVINKKGDAMETIKAWVRYKDKNSYTLLTSHERPNSYEGYTVELLGDVDIIKYNKLLYANGRSSIKELKKLING